MNQIVNLSPGSIPAHIAQSQRLNLNAAAHANLAPSFAVVGYKGRNWRLKYRGEDELLQASAGTDHTGRPLPKTPVTTLSVVIVGMAAAVSKAFYEKRYAEGDDGSPDCFSINGVAPDAASPSKQSPSCAACFQNKFGSRTTDNGKKAKACPDYRRLAVVPAGDEANDAFGGAMLLRIPPMSLLNLDRYCRQLEAVGADISQVVTVLGFNLDVSYPEITFVTDGWISDPQAYETVLEHARSDQVHRMLEESMVEAATENQPAPAAEVVALAASRPAHMAPANTLGIRHDNGGNDRQDYYVDPKNDYVCILHIVWTKRDGQWTKARQYTLSGLHRIVDHVVAGTQESHYYPDPTLQTRGDIRTSTIDLVPVNTSDYPASIFDPKPLLTGATVEGF